MKKSLVYGSVAGALTLAGIGGVFIANNSSALQTSDDLNNKIAQETEFGKAANTKKVSSKNETVYLIADADGEIKSTFVGNNLYTGDETLPFEFDVKYYLDGAEISASDLAGKSGHVKIVYSLKSTKTSGGKFVPFVAGTGVTLDGTKFSNIKVKNGKIISENDKCIIAGYSFPGLGDNLGVDFLDGDFSIEADTTDFALDTTYTVLLNDLIADIDTNKLNDLDSVVSAINKLAEATDEISAGANKLADGTAAALDGAKKLEAGAEKLAAGVDKMSTGADKLAGGLNLLTSKYNASLQAGAKSVITSTLTTVNNNLSTAMGSNPALATAISSMMPISVENYAENLPKIYAITRDDSLNSTKGLLDLTTGIIGYTQAVGGDILTGASDLATGLKSAKNEMPTLVNGAGALVDGLTELYNGSVILRDGIKTFNESGIQKLVKFARNDLDGFINNARATVNAARSYKNFSNSSAESVKFIIKTASIK